MKIGDSLVLNDRNSITLYEEGELRFTFKFRKYVLFLGLSFLLLKSLNAQISIKFEKPDQKVYYLQQIKGDRIINLDTASISASILNFNWKTNYQQGMYRLFDGSQGLIFWAGGEEIQLEISEPFVQDSLYIINSKENQIWKDYSILKNTNYQNLDLLNPIINWYDKESDFYQLALSEFTRQQNAIPIFVQSVKKKYPDTWILPYLEADIKPILPMGLSYEEQKKYLQEHWFDGVNWYDYSLINSDILTNKITEYLGLYTNRDFTKPQLELAFKVAVDQIIPKTKGNPDMYAFVMDYLVRGFEKYNFEEVILHIAINYPPPAEQCENEERKSEALVRLEKYESMQIGQVAPNILLPNIQGELINIAECQKENILIVFWASWCPHCTLLIPQIQNWYSTEIQEYWQVYCISLDTDQTDLQAYLREANIQLETLCSHQGWDTPAAINYNIYATPTMIVLDKERKIWAKPQSINELMK